MTIRLAALLCLAFLLVAPAFAQGTLAARCADLGQEQPSGLYVFTVEDHGLMQVYCDNEMEADGRRGGWMLVWSNLRGGGGDPATGISWWTSINTPPRITGVTPIGNGHQERQLFEVFTGLRWWVALTGADSEAEMVYEWATNYSPERRIDQRAFCHFRLDPLDSYRIFFDSPSCRQLVGQAGLPGLFTAHSGAKWSTDDVDNDTREEPSNDLSCAAKYSRAPFWYTNCWSGSINGSGELLTSGHKNGAYWSASHSAYAANQPSNTAAGAGNGWIYVRPKGGGH